MSTINIVVRDKEVIFHHRNQRFICQLLGHNNRPHNDHLVLAALSAFNPYIQESYIPKIGIPISNRLESTLVDLGYEFHYTPGNVDTYEGTTPGLSYSAGIDSTCAAHIMQKGVAIYLSRAMKFDVFAGEAIKEIRDRGWTSFQCKCTVEKIRNPIGFPVDIACSIPCIVNANKFNIDSISYGTVLESSYSIGRLKYRDYSKTHHFTHWNSLFTAAGLPFNQVTAGLSEVATFDIFNQSGLKGKSCLKIARGDCKWCYKCYRRYLLKGIKLPNSKAINHGIKKKHHLNILNYAHEKYNINTHTNCVNDNLQCLDKLYPKAIELLPIKYQESTRERIDSLVGTMNKEECNRIESYVCPVPT